MSNQAVLVGQSIFSLIDKAVEKRVQRTYPWEIRALQCGRMRCLKSWLSCR